MFKGNDMIGKPVITYSSGEAIEKVADIIYDSNSNQILGLLVDEGGLFSAARIIPFSAIKAIGPDAVTVQDKGVVIQADTDPKVQSILNKDVRVHGLTVMTEDGQDLGKISDICFDETTGQVSGYDVSGGIFADAYSGRSFIPAPKAFKIGKDVAFVPNDTAAMLEQQVGGVKKAAMQTGEKVKEGAATLRDKTKETVDKASQTARQGMDKAQAKLQSPETEQLKAKTGQAMSQTRDSLKHGTAEAKDTAGDVWERIKQTATNLKEQTQQEIEDRRIKDALGRPVTRVIFDQADQPILNAGSLITHEAIEKARQADALDILLDSVYHTKPAITNEDLKIKK